MSISEEKRIKSKLQLGFVMSLISFPQRRSWLLVTIASWVKIIIPSIMNITIISVLLKNLSIYDTDIAHVYSKFLGPLPLTTEEFVSSVNKYFPHIIDTKILLNTNFVLQQRMRKSKTSLSAAFASLCPQTALSSKSTKLALQQCVQVEVQVDDLRFACPSAYKVDLGSMLFSGKVHFAPSNYQEFRPLQPNYKSWHMTQLKYQKLITFLPSFKSDGFGRGTKCRFLAVWESKFW